MSTDVMIRAYKNPENHEQRYLLQRERQSDHGLRPKGFAYRKLRGYCNVSCISIFKGGDKERISTK